VPVDIAQRDSRQRSKDTRYGVLVVAETVDKAAPPRFWDPEAITGFEVTPGVTNAEAVLALLVVAE
jgi:hypothetical protein